MKTLYLVRHAKSSWKFDVKDERRPLNARGLEDAPMMANYIASKMPKPQKVLSSPAVRALTTAIYFAKAYGIDEDAIEVIDALYDFGGQQLVNTIRGYDNQFDHIMVFGHNNAMTNFVNTYGNLPTDNVPTTGFTAIEFDMDVWSDLKKGNTLFSAKPKDLK